MTLGETVQRTVIITPFVSILFPSVQSHVRLEFSMRFPFVNRRATIPNVKHKCEANLRQLRHLISMRRPAPAKGSIADVGLRDLELLW